MARIKINDLAKDAMISQDEMKKVFGGILVTTATPSINTNYQSLNISSFNPTGGIIRTAGCGCMGMGQDPGVWIDEGRPAEYTR